MRPGFQRWASSFPLTRRVARRKARETFDLVAGFVYSQVLAATVRLGLLPMLADGPQDAPALARRLGLPVEAASRLLHAAASLKLAQAVGDGRFVLGERGAALLGNPGALAMVEHHAIVYDDLRDPVALLRGEVRATRLSAFWTYAGERRDAAPEAAAAYSALMAASMPLLADDILEAYRFARHRRLLDVGGGEGAFAAAVAARTQDIRITVFDLPEVAARAERRLSGPAFSGRIDVAAGDFFAGLPAGADAASLVRILHDHDDDAALRLLRAIHAALPPGGALLVAEPFAGEAGAEPIGDAYFGFYLLAMGQGRARRPAEVLALLGQAGFASARLVRTRRPMLTGLIVATR
ncbi:methyltransferase [Alsobacter sp. KACC 23698]|uniref:Methyltransferase n=2 Tax=Alsobacter sp. KACC 23698 TaxID=3149229 RepID=A0AAU7JP02_9HYPH